MQISPLELYDAIAAGRRPAILDVRNAEEYSRWKIEGPGRVSMFNLPYFAFIDHESSAVAKAREWKSAQPGPLYIVCAKGDSSSYVADLLKESGLPADNLAGGMNAWGQACAVKPLGGLGSSLRAWQFLRFGKGCLSYIVAAGRDALVVDPHRRVEDYRRVVAAAALKLRGVFDTHLHADHLSGARALAEAEHAPYFAGPADFGAARFDFASVADGRRLTLGEDGVSFQFLRAPGHTPGGMLLLADNRLLFTGDTLFVGGVGRPDLGGRAREWADDLFETLTVRMGHLDGNVRVLPAHTQGPSELRPDGTLGETLADLRQRLPLLRLNRKLFVEAILDRVVAAPPSYEKIRRLNLGLNEVSEEGRTELELGKNECALARKA